MVYTSAILQIQNLQKQDLEEMFPPWLDVKEKMQIFTGCVTKSIAHLDLDREELVKVIKELKVIEEKREESLHAPRVNELVDRHHHLSFIYQHIFLLHLECQLLFQVHHFLLLMTLTMRLLVLHRQHRRLNLQQRLEHQQVHEHQRVHFNPQLQYSLHYSQPLHSFQRGLIFLQLPQSQQLHYLEQPLQQTHRLQRYQDQDRYH